MNALTIQTLSHSYPGTRKHPSRQVLSNLNLTVTTGEIFGLLGPNGGGKSTLFKILSTLMIPSNGSVRILDLDVLATPAAVRQKIGVVFQSPSLDKKLTLLENILHQGRLYGLTGQNLRDRADLLLAQMNLSDRKDDFVEHLSGGLQRRGEIAKGLMHKPALLLMDEPSTGLDPGARRDLWDVLFQLKKEGITILLTTHLMEEADHCDRLAILHHGHCVAMGTPDELKSKIGGDVITIQSPQASALAEKIQQKFQLKTHVLDRVIRLEKSQGHTFIPILVEAFPGLIEAITMGKPTLEDVFVHETGERLGANS